MILRTWGWGGNSLTGSISPDIGAWLSSVFPAQMSASLPHSFSFLNRIKWLRTNYICIVLSQSLLLLTVTLVLDYLQHLVRKITEIK